MGYIPHIFSHNLIEYYLGYIVYLEEMYMTIKEAVEIRINELCEMKEITINTLANNSGISPSTIYSMTNEKSKNPGVVSIKKFYDGLDISIRDFFNTPLFDELEQELK